MTQQTDMLNAQWDTGSQSTDWAGFFQGLTQTVVSGYAAADSAQRQQQFELDKAKIQYMGDNGYYTEGQPMYSSGNSNLLLIGAGLLLVVFFVLKD